MSYARNPPARSCGEHFVRECQKFRQIFGIFLFFSPSVSRKMAASNFTKISSTFSTVHQIKFFHCCNSGSRGAQGCHSGRRAASNSLSRARDTVKQKHLDADIHGLEVRTSDCRGGSTNFSSKNRVAPVRLRLRFWGWNGSSGSGFRFRRFLCKKGFSVFHSVQFNRKGRFRFRFRFLENGSGFAFGCRKNGSDGSSFRFRFGSSATL